MRSDDLSPLPTNKRKRESIDQLDASRALRSQNTNGDAGNSSDGDLAALQMLQSLVQNGLQDDDDNTKTARAALATPMQQPSYPPPDSSFDTGSSLQHGLPSFDDVSHSPSGGFNAISPSTQALMAAREATTMNSNKPAVGTAQWHQQRKDNHKEGKHQLCLPNRHLSKR